MPHVREQIVATVQNGLLRPGADATYADGDDHSWMGVDWPSLTGETIVAGRRINYVDTGPTGNGSGGSSALIFIHGLGGIWQNWLLNIPPFMDARRIVAMDLPGFGGSELPAEPISIRGYAKVVDELLDQLGVERGVVVGNSMGGFIGAELALSFSTRVEKLVLVSAAGLSIEYQRREPLLSLARVWQPVNAHVFAARRDLFARRPRLRRAALQTVVRYPEKLSGPLTWEILQGQGKPGFVGALDALMSYSFRERLREIGMPVLIVWGRNDMLVPVSDADRFEELIGPNARKVLFDDTGHVPMIERPSRFNDLLRGFLEGDPRPEVGVTGVRAD